MLVNVFLKPNKLLRHLETNDFYYKNRCKDFFLFKKTYTSLKEINKMIKSFTTGNEMYLKCSYLTAMHVARSKKKHTSV